MLTTVSIYFREEEIEEELMKTVLFLNTHIDMSEPSLVLTKMEEGRDLLANTSKCFASLDYYNKLNAKRVGTQYAIYSSLKEYSHLIKKDLETTLLNLGTALSYFKNERYR